GGRTLAQPELDRDVRPFGVGLFRTLSRDRPEVRRVVRDEGKPAGGRTFPAATGQNEHGRAGERDSCLQAHSTLLMMERHDRAEPELDKVSKTDVSRAPLQDLVADD